MFLRKNPRARAPVWRATKLEEELTGETETGRIQDAVEKWLYDTKTPEGRTREHFVANFGELESNPRSACVMTRQFVDGMSDHILDTRMDELSLLQVDMVVVDDSYPFL